MSLRQIGRVICVELTEGCVLCAQLRACLLLLLISEPARKLVHLVSLISRRNSTVQHTYRYVAPMQMWMLCSPVQTVSKSWSCRVFSCSTTLKKTMQEVKTQRNKSKGVRGEKKKGVKVHASAVQKSHCCNLLTRVHLSKGHLSFCKSALTDAAADRVSAKERRQRKRGAEGVDFLYIPQGTMARRQAKGRMRADFTVHCKLSFLFRPQKASNGPSDPSSLPRAKHT